jgi:hypothetical protein
MKKLLALLVTITALAQGTPDDPIIAGNAAKFVWEAGDTNSAIQYFGIYVNSQLTAKVYTTNVDLSSILKANGTYQLNVNAVNAIGTSDMSTNLWVRYFANRPTPPKGLTIKQN